MRQDLFTWLGRSPGRLAGGAVVLIFLLTPGCQRPKNGADGSGTIECTQIQIAPQVAGRLLKLDPREGDAVKAGQIVARIDDADWLLKREEARAAINQAQAQLDLMLAGARQEDIDRAREQVREARAAFEAAQADLKRIEEVYRLKSATQKQYDDARTMAERTAASLAAAEINFKKLAAGNRQEEIKLARTQLELAKTRLAQVEKAIADCAVVAPASGIVTVRIREDGEMAGVGTPLLTVSRLDEVWLSVYIPETRLGKVKLGQKARVKIDSSDHFYSGVITYVSPEAEFTPRNVQTPDERSKLVYRVKITLQNPEGIFKPGMPADGYLDPETPAQSATKP